MPTATAVRDAIIELPQMDMRTISVQIVGDAELIVHNWSEKAKKEMRDKQMGKARNKKEPKDPDEDFKGSIYWLPDSKHGFPSIAFKAAAITAVTSVQGVTKVLMRQAFHVLGEFVELTYPNGQPRMREDMVRIGMGTADLRYRAGYQTWGTTLPVRYNANTITLEQLLHLLNLGGASVGVGEWRPERDGNFGLFHVESVAEGQPWSV